MGTDVRDASGMLELFTRIYCDDLDNKYYSRAKLIPDLKNPENIVLELNSMDIDLDVVVSKNAVKYSIPIDKLIEFIEQNGIKVP